MSEPCVDPTEEDALYGAGMAAAQLFGVNVPDSSGITDCVWLGLDDAAFFGDVAAVPRTMAQALAMVEALALRDGVRPDLVVRMYQAGQMVRHVLADGFPALRDGGMV